MKDLNCINHNIKQGKERQHVDGRNESNRVANGVYVKAIYVKSEQLLNDASNVITRMGERTGHTWLGEDI